MSEITGSKYFADTIKAYGVSHVFMVPTIAVTALAEMDRIDVVGVSTHGEKAAAYMADGYARASRGPGVCLAQTIGATNLAAGLRDAYLGHSPVVAFTGGTEPMTRQKGVYQEIEDFPIFEKLTKYNMQVDDARRLPDLLRQCFRIATSGAPQPVHLEFQGIVGTVLDDWFEPSETDVDHQAETRYSQLPPHRPAPDPTDIASAVDLISQAERPLIVAGQGVRISGAMEELKTFAEKAHVPVATTLTAKGAIDESGPLAVGVIGGAARSSATKTGQRADLVIFVGTSTGSQATSNWTVPAYGTTTIQVDVEPAQLGRNYPPTVGILADAKTTLAALVAEYTTSPTQARAAWVDEVHGYVAEFREEFRTLTDSDDGPLRPERLCREITDFLPDDGVLVIDTGHAGIWSGGYIDLKPSQETIRAMGSLGWSFPASIGAKAAVGDRTVVCLTGDGGFYYHLQEIETAVRHGLAPIVVVNNNVALSQDMKIFQYSWGGPDAITHRGDNMWVYTDVELAQVAERLGAWSVRVDDPKDLRPALDEAAVAGRVAVVDARTPAEALPPTPDFYTSLVKNLTPQGPSENR